MMEYLRPSKGILLYDYLFSKGGAEKLSFSILSRMRPMDFCVGLKDDALFPADVTSVGGGRFYTLTDYSSKKGWKTLKTLLTFIFSDVFHQKYEWAIYSGEYAPMAILRNKNKAKRNILYCHTIPRAPYDLKEFKLSRLGPLNRVAFHVLCNLITALYEPSIRRMDVVVANSENVRRRIKKYIGIDAKVVNPPIDLDKFKWIGQGDYYLSTARLEPAKRVDLIVQAFINMPDKKLVVASGGSEYGRLVEMAKGCDNIEFLGWASDDQIYEAVGNCIATIYIPVDEDFGMSPVESMSAGKPVIGVAEGGLLETVVCGETGILLDLPTPEGISGVVRNIHRNEWLKMRESCEQRAKNYSEDVFISRISEIVGSV